MPPALRRPTFAPCQRFTPIETERLRLRVVTPEDVDAMLAYQSRAEVCRYLLYEPRDREAVAALIADRAPRTRLRDAGDSLQITVVRRDDGQVLGELYFAIDSVEQSCAEIGWIFHPDAGGRGYATEAALALLAFAFETMGLHRVIARLHPDNAASVRLCDRLGMRREAHLVEDLWNKGAWEDTGVHALLAREWAARGRAARGG